MALEILKAGQDDCVCACICIFLCGHLKVAVILNNSYVYYRCYVEVILRKTFVHVTHVNEVFYVRRSCMLFTFHETNLKKRYNVT